MLPQRSLFCVDAAPVCASPPVLQLHFCLPHHESPPGILLQADTMVGTSGVLGSAQAKFKTVSNSCRAACSTMPPSLAC
jgi:hypothetical protein